MREFLPEDDLADACLFLLRHYEDATHINVGTGEDLSIRALAELVREIVHPSAELVFDTSKPDGTPRKVLDVSKLRALGWAPSIGLEQGVRDTYAWFLAHQDDSEARGVAPAEAALSAEPVRSTR
jgi:GDP-L-fucose synthase